MVSYSYHYKTEDRSQPWFIDIIEEIDLDILLE